MPNKESVLFHTIKIKVPEHMISVNKKGEIIIKDTVTPKAKQITKANKKPAIQIIPQDKNIVEIVDAGTIVDTTTGKPPVAEKKPTKKTEKKTVKPPVTEKKPTKKTAKKTVKPPVAEKKPTEKTAKKTETKKRGNGFDVPKTTEKFKNQLITIIQNDDKERMQSWHNEMFEGPTEEWDDDDAIKLYAEEMSGQWLDNDDDDDDDDDYNSEKHKRKYAKYAKYFFAKKVLGEFFEAYQDIIQNPKDITPERRDRFIYHLKTSGEYGKKIPPEVVEYAENMKKKYPNWFKFGEWYTEKYGK